MILNFHIHYVVRNNQKIQLSIEKNGQQAQSINLQTFDNQNWTLALEVQSGDDFSYNYVVVSGNLLEKEWGKKRFFKVEQNVNNIYIFDTWRTLSDSRNSFLTAAFTQVLFHRNPVKKSTHKKTKSKNSLKIRLLCGEIPSDLHYGICGNSPELGNWITPVAMTELGQQNWEINLPIDSQDIFVEYKYVIYNKNTGKILLWENGNNRQIQHSFPFESGNEMVVQNDHFRFGAQRWKGTGVAIPIFSLRTKDSFGVGEFTDIKKMADWASQVKIQLIQVLPVNDTIATKTWTDSYPYAAISVFALHPLYIHIPSIAAFKDKKVATQYAQDAKSLEALAVLDFEKVLHLKWKYFELLFEQEKKAFLKDKNTSDFIEKNKEWLKPYAVFCCQRDKYKTVNFHEWATMSAFSSKECSAYFKPNHPDYENVLFYIFLQYHADKQLKEAKAYSSTHNIVLKGDLPIGIYRYSCDAWVAPELYNMSQQAGAPPDAFSELGQNWGFPTYNWDVMAKDNFSWWAKRMQKLSEYFDVLRIDHILGFFRIWQIPTEQVQGTMGMFNPRIPISIEEIRALGKQYDLERWTKPYIRGHFLYELFGEDTSWVVQEFLQEIAHNMYQLRENANTQQKVKKLFEQKGWTNKGHILSGLYKLISEVLFLEEPNSDGRYFNPRINVFQTKSYKELPDNEKEMVAKLYKDYFYHRHEDFWKQQALWKLPALLQASDMLICGEDLGMLPDSVPDVLSQLNILSLEIQRMPKGKTLFGDTANYPYMSVCSPSCHDMSTIRGWWQADYDTSKKFFYNFMHWYGMAPKDCSTDIVNGIVGAHLSSPSMLAIFPIQDLLGTDAELRRRNANEEQINDPSNPNHYWRYRLHLTMETLLESSDFNSQLKRLIEDCGR